MPERQALVVDPEQMKGGSVDIVTVGRVLCDTVRPFVALAIASTTFEAAASEPRRKREWIMIAAKRTLATRLVHAV